MLAENDWRLWKSRSLQQSCPNRLKSTTVQDFQGFRPLWPTNHQIASGWCLRSSTRWIAQWPWSNGTGQPQATAWLPNMPILVGHKDAFQHHSTHFESINPKKARGEAKVTLKAIQRDRKRSHMTLKGNQQVSNFKWLLCWKGTKIPSW